MKVRSLLLHVLFLLIGSGALLAQEAKYLGRIISSVTQKPVKNATITTRDSSYATSSNFLGYFELTGGAMEVIVSHVAYETSIVALTPANPQVQIVISPRIYKLKTLNELDRSLVQRFAYKEFVHTEQMNARKTDSNPEILADFPGGLREFHKYLVNDLIDNRASLKEAFTSTVRFHVDETGAVLVDSIINPPFFSEYLVNLFNNCPKWIPALQRNQPETTWMEQKLSYDPDANIWAVVEAPPEYIGGLLAFYDFIKANLKYPSEAKKEEIMGKVYVSFIVDKGGQLQDISIDSGLGYGCDEEAVRVVSLTSGMWVPGQTRGRPVEVKLVLPISFKGL